MSSCTIAIMKEEWIIFHIFDGYDFEMERFGINSNILQKTWGLAWKKIDSIKKWNSYSGPKSKQSILLFSPYLMNLMSQNLYFDEFSELTCPFLDFGQFQWVKIWKLQFRPKFKCQILKLWVKIRPAESSKFGFRNRL